MSSVHPLAGFAGRIARAQIDVVIPWAFATPVGAEGVRVPLAALVQLVLAELDIRPVEITPSDVQLRVLRLLRGGRKMVAKSLRTTVGRRFYDRGPGSVNELLEEGLLVLTAGKYSLSEIGEAKAAEFLD